jgi:hypothetical protein
MTYPTFREVCLSCHEHIPTGEQHYCPATDYNTYNEGN